ncbi:hypothetical protein DDD63_11920 [Actinobaculum sp. 313]|nr:hypothetical protein DDD63_11920 [Actinobaculum sp. 313]
MADKDPLLRLLGDLDNIKTPIRQRSRNLRSGSLDFKLDSFQITRLFILLPHLWTNYLQRFSRRFADRRPQNYTRVISTAVQNPVDKSNAESRAVA